MEKTINLKVSGMTCNHCKSFIINTLKEIKGIKDVEVNLESGIAQATATDDQIKAEDLIKKVNDSGIYTAQKV